MAAMPASAMVMLGRGPVAFRSSQVFQPSTSRETDAVSGTFTGK
nr:hypothetical protein [Streptomyces viridochromogenes]